MICSARANLPQVYTKNGDIKQNRWVRSSLLSSFPFEPYETREDERGAKNILSHTRAHAPLDDGIRVDHIEVDQSLICRYCVVRPIPLAFRPLFDSPSRAWRVAFYAATRRKALRRELAGRCAFNARQECLLVSMVSHMLSLFATFLILTRLVNAAMALKS